MSEDASVRPDQADKDEFEMDGASGVGAVEHPLTAGVLLREARLAKGIDIATLAALLKVPVIKIQALEQDEFALLLDPAFARALASSVCRVLNIDSAPVLQQLPAITAFTATPQNRGINTPFRARKGGHGLDFWPNISKSVILVGVALLFGAVVLIFLPDIQQEIKRYQQADSGVERKNELIELVSITTPVVISAASGDVVEELVRNPPREVLTAVAVQSSLSASNAADAKTQAMISFSATGESWVKVTDAKGAVVLERTLRTGESAEASGAPPLNAVVGRADVIQVQVRGQVFGLSSATNNNVARFEVK